MGSILITGFLATGLLLILTGAALPSLREQRKFKKLGKPGRRANMDNLIVSPVSRRLARLIRIMPENRERLEALLADAGFTMTPEEYRARPFVVAGIFFYLHWFSSCCLSDSSGLWPGLLFL